MNRRITHILLIFVYSLLGCTKYYKESCHPEPLLIQSNTIEDDLIEAARQGDLQRVVRCIEQGADINVVKAQDGKSPLAVGPCG